MNPNITTEIGSWFKTRTHSAPLSSTEFIVYVELKFNGIRIGEGVSYRPVSEMPYVTTDAELQETSFWLEMLNEAGALARKQSECFLAKIRETAA